MRNETIGNSGRIQKKVTSITVQNDLRISVMVPSFQIHRFHAEAFGSILTRIDSAISLLSDQLKPMTCEIPLMNPSSDTSCSCSMSFMFYLWTY